MAKHLYRKDSGNLISKVADTPGEEEQLRAQGFMAIEELWPSPTVVDAPTVTAPPESESDETRAATPIDEPRKRKGKV